MSRLTKIISLTLISLLFVGAVIFAFITRDDLSPRAYMTVLGIAVIGVKLFMTPIKDKKNASGESNVENVQNSANKKSKNSLAEDIAIAKDWVAGALNSSGYNADFSIESLKEIERFFDEQSGEDGIISKNRGRILFGLGVYLGETMIQNIGGEWDLESCDDDEEIEVPVKLKGNNIIFPIIRVINRYKNGSEDNVYHYAVAIRTNIKNISEIQDKINRKDK